VGGVVSGASHQVGGVVSGASHRVGGVVSGASHRAGGVVSDATHRVGGAVSGPKERTIFRETYQGAGSGAAGGAAAGAVMGPPGAVVGAESGAVGGAVVGFGQGVYDTNKGYFEDRDPGKNLPKGARPGTDVRVGYQAALKAAAAAEIGDYAVMGSPSTVKAVGGAAAWAAAKAVFKNESNHGSALTNSVSALQRAGHADPRRPVGLGRPSDLNIPNH
jgi:hypothetical protein